ncbi:hypothetical protein niasHS_003990 [Heterodera schachtii]|uniref:Uncharacterized protein n=1 Tax=Heterodera schachtii TaxID=97005 RepID=A0ABD2K3W3_HETSC
MSKLATFMLFAVHSLSSDAFNPSSNSSSFILSSANESQRPIDAIGHSVQRRRESTAVAMVSYTEGPPEFVYTAGGASDAAKTQRRPSPAGADPFNAFAITDVPLMRLTKDILAPGRYDVRVRPIIDHTKPLKVHISMSLYQIIEVNEPAQNIKMNVWMIQKWHDEMLHWDPREYDMINSTILPHEVLWIPDTYVYNSVVMNADETERYMNIRVDTLFWEGRQGATMSFLYPAIYTVTCRLNIRYFPYDQQNCTLTISSWTNSKSALDYYADEKVNLASFIPNEEWEVASFRIFRHEYKYACCPEPWVILEASIVLRRKPLYYVINLIIPTSIITLVAITGFFTPASTADDRTEKINLGITTLLAMSILMLMVSDQMPTTSEFVPLIAWFYLSIIIIISIGTFLTSVILSVQSRRQYGQLPSLPLRFIFFVKLAHWLCLSVPPPLLALWEELNDHPLTTMERKRKVIQGKQQKGEKRSTTNSGRRKKQLADEKQKMTKMKNGGGGGDGQIHLRPQRFSMPRGIGDAFAGSDNANNNIAGFTFGTDRAMASPTLPNFALSPPPPPMHYDAISATDEADDERSRARDNWLRASRRASQHPSEHLSPRADATVPLAMNVLSGVSRRSSIATTNWENAIGGLGVTPPQMKEQEKAGTAAAVKRRISFLVSGASAEVNSMKVKRQCSLEWEFIATILDRLFLFLFTLTVTVITAGIMIVGRIAQWQYEQLLQEIGD